MIRANAVRDITGIVMYPNAVKNIRAHDSPVNGHGTSALPPDWTNQLYAATAKPNNARQRATPSVRRLPFIHANKRINGNGNINARCIQHKEQGANPATSE